MLRRLGRHLALVGALVVVGMCPAMASASTPVPAGFVGVNVDGPLYPTLSAGINPFAQAKLMEQSGVESVRAVFSWAYAQPYASFAQVPASQRAGFVNVDGVPTRFGQIDALVAHAARVGISVLPVVIYAPAWDAVGATPDSLPQPARPAPYAAFLAALVHRYGPGGSFWKAHRSGIPITRWQIWNEPNLSYDWPTQPFAPTYVALLKAASEAIRGVDPSAQVVLGGLADYSWQALAAIYKVPGARAAFDIDAVHPYTAQPAGVITILELNRRVMDRNGDGAKPMIASEIGWASSLGHTNPVDGLPVASTSQRGQARDIASLLPMLTTDRRSLGLIGFDYYTWASTEINGFNFSYSGLFRYAHGSLQAKPAYAAFRRDALAMEGCRVKGSVASVCAQR